MTPLLLEIPASADATSLRAGQLYGSSRSLFLAEQIAAHRGTGASEFDSAEIADMFYVAAAQAKYKADNRPQLERRLLVLRRSVLAMLAQD